MHTDIWGAEVPNVPVREQSVYRVIEFGIVLIVIEGKGDNVI